MENEVLNNPQLKRRTKYQTEKTSSSIRLIDPEMGSSMACAAPTGAFKR
jgi:hypothetical protein